MAFGDFTVDRNSTKYVLGNGGTIVPVATDEPAIEFNADGTYKGLLVEPAATNLATYSEDFTQWTNNNSTDSIDSGVSGPDGVAGITKLTPDIGSPTDTPSVYIISTQTVETRTFSVFMKAGEYTKGALRIGGNTGDNDPVGVFDLSAGTVLSTQGVGVSASIQSIGNGWYRCSLKYNNGTGSAGTNQAFAPNIVPLSDTYTVGADGIDVTADGTSGIYIWGAQLETGPIATSYIPTTTASVTRVKDDITQTGAQSLIGQTEGTLYVEVDWKATGGVQQNLFSVNDGTTSNRMLIYHSGGTLYMFARADGAILTNQGGSSSGYSGIQKIAFAYAEDDFELYRNGSSISSDTSGSLAALATMTDIDLGQAFDANQQANMHIRAVAIYPTRLGAVELEVLTGAPTYGSYALMASSLGYTVA